MSTLKAVIDAEKKSKVLVEEALENQKRAIEETNSFLKEEAQTLEKKMLNELKQLEEQSSIN